MHGFYAKANPNTNPCHQLSPSNVYTLVSVQVWRQTHTDEGSVSGRNSLLSPLSFFLSFLSFKIFFLRINILRLGIVWSWQLCPFSSILIFTSKCWYLLTYSLSLLKIILKWLLMLIPYYINSLGWFTPSFLSHLHLTILTALIFLYSCYTFHLFLPWTNRYG